MIIDGYRFAKYLDDTGLSAEEFYLCYRTMIQEKNIAEGILRLPGLKEGDSVLKFSQWSETYQQRHKLNIDWTVMCWKMETLGYMSIMARDKAVIKLSEIKVTDKFKSYFLTSDIDKLFEDFLQLYPDWVFVNNNKYPALDKPKEELVKLFDKFILKGGNILLGERFLLLTEKYLSGLNTKSAPYKISNYITEAYHGIAETLEKEANYDDPFSEEA